MSANCAGYARKVIITKTVEAAVTWIFTGEGGRAASPSARHWLAEPQFQGGAIGRHFTSRVDVGMRVKQRQPPWLYERQNPSMGRACGCSCLKPRLLKGRSLCSSRQAWRRSQILTTVSSVWTFLQCRLSSISPHPPPSPVHRFNNTNHGDEPADVSLAEKGSGLRLLFHHAGERKNVPFLIPFR